MKKHRTKKPTLKPMLPPVHFAFRLDVGGKTFDGTLSTTAGTEIVTLPMGINSLLVNFANDYPEIHEAKEMTITAVILDSAPKKRSTKH